MAHAKGVLGDRLLEAMALATTDIVLIAPYMKVSVLRRMLGSTKETVRGLVLTRWRPEEVAAGVSDLEYSMSWIR